MTHINYTISIHIGISSPPVSANHLVAISNAFEHEHRTINVFIDGVCEHTFELESMEHLPQFIEAQFNDLNTQMPCPDSAAIKAICLDLMKAAITVNLGPFDSCLS